jgi:ribosomal protein S18 acetylase RimI-like enzyme
MYVFVPFVKNDLFAQFMTIGYDKISKRGDYILIHIKAVNNPKEKSDICNTILQALPNWFGIEESIMDYVQQVKTLPFIAAYNNDAAIGFAAVKPHTQYASEICVMGILSDYHRRGIGKQLITACEQICRENKTEYLTVKTLADSHKSKSYEKTRLFYTAQGFKPIEVFPTLWDETNPCLFMIKAVAK